MILFYFCYVFIHNTPLLHLFNITFAIFVFLFSLIILILFLIKNNKRRKYYANKTANMNINFGVF